MRIKRGEHVSYLPKFEDIESWQLAQEVAYKSNHQSNEACHHDRN